MVVEETAMKNRLNVTPSKCIGCRTCEIACAFSHSVGGTMGKSRVSVANRGGGAFVPMLCLQCGTPACAAACQVGALARNPETGAVEVIQAKCVKCMQCVAACPFGNMHAEPSASGVFKCDLCGGNPKCAMFCPTKTLEYSPVRIPARAAVR